MNRLPYVQEYRDRHGKIRRYFRRSGSRRIPLPGRPGSQEFMTAYNAAQAGYVVREMKTVGKNRSAPGSLSAAIAAYYTDAHLIYPGGMTDEDWVHDLPYLVNENWSSR